MIKVVGIWLFCLGILIDIPLGILQYFDMISWGWEIIIAIPFVLSILGAVAFAIIYGLLKLIVTLIMIL